MAAYMPENEPIYLLIEHKKDGRMAVEAKSQDEVHFSHTLIKSGHYKLYQVTKKEELELQVIIKAKGT
jgi:hypothetical protein